MSEKFMQDVKAFVETKRRLLKDKSILAYEETISLRKMDPTGIYELVASKPFLTQKELLILEMLSLPEVYETFSKYEVYA